MDVKWFLVILPDKGTLACVDVFMSDKGPDKGTLTCVEVLCLIRNINIYGC